MTANPAIDKILINVPVPILTPRLLLRPPQDSDGEAVYEAARESHAELSKWMIWAWTPPEKMSVEEYEGFCCHKQAKFILREQLTFMSFDRQTNDFIGSASLSRCNWEHGFFTLGYWVRISRAKQGYATEAATALCHYAFKVLGAKRISSYHADGNDGSAKVLENIGFEKEGVLRKQHVLADKVVDEHLYGLLDVENLPSLNIQWGPENLK